MMRQQIREGKKKNGLQTEVCNPLISFNILAEWTGLEPATPGVTGRYSNQLNYHSAWLLRLLCACDTKPSAAQLGDPTGIRTPVLTVKG